MTSVDPLLAIAVYINIPIVRNANTTIKCNLIAIHWRMCKLKKKNKLSFVRSGGNVIQCIIYSKNVHRETQASLQTFALWKTVLRIRKKKKCLLFSLLFDSKFHQSVPINVRHLSYFKRFFFSRKNALATRSRKVSTHFKDVVCQRTNNVQIILLALKLHYYYYYEKCNLVVSNILRFSRYTYTIVQTTVIVLVINILFYRQKTVIWTLRRGTFAKTLKLIKIWILWFWRFSIVNVIYFSTRKPYTCEIVFKVLYTLLGPPNELYKRFFFENNSNTAISFNIKTHFDCFRSIFYKGALQLYVCVRAQFVCAQCTV